VHHVDADLLKFHSLILGYVRGPPALVVVTPHCIDWSYGSQLFEDLGAANVSRMNDAMHAG
jgi:hypothetical protein